MDIKQFLGGSDVPVGSSVPMPALANAGTNQFVTQANELFVNTATPSIIPQSSCNSVLIAALGATNDIVLPTTQVNLSSFQQASNVPASGFNAALITGAYQQSTKGFYVGGTYYLFSPNDTSNTIGWISTTDTQNYTGFVPITPLAGLMIVDIFYNSANSTWYFLEANGSIYSTTNLTTFANGTFYSLPALGFANGYVRLTLINGVWYAIGGSTGGTGYRVSSSTNLTAWTVAIENTSAGQVAFNIVQGAGAGATTEILVCCNNNTILKSTNNGASFTAVTNVLTISGSTPYINNIFYSPRTGLYYIAATAASNAVYFAVSTTGTLATAGWTTYNTGYNSTGTSLTANINIIDTGTWVGPVYMTTGWQTFFFYGASYNTLSSPLITQPQVWTLESSTTTNYQGAKAMWLNNMLLVAYSSMPDWAYGYSRSNVMLAVASGATCSTGNNINLWFPISTATSSAPTTPLQWNSWSGIAYMGGAYYAGAGATSMSGSTIYFYTMSMFKIAATLATFSCPVPPVQGSFNNVAMSWGSMIALSCPVIGVNGTSVYWSAYANWNAPNTSNTLGYIANYVYNGATLTSCTFASTGASGTGGGSIQGYCIPGQPSGNVTVPKWSSMLNAYVVALPAVAVGTGNNIAVQAFPAMTNGSTPTSIFSGQASSGGSVSILGLDVFSTGGVVIVVQEAATLYLQVNMGAGTVQLFTSMFNGTTGVPANYAIWEIVSGGVSYLAYAYTNALSVTSLNIYKLSTTGGTTLVLQNYPVPNISLNGTVTNNLRRVFSNNGSFYLGDTVASSTSNRNSLLLTPNGVGSFTVAPVCLNVPGDVTPAGQPNTFTSMNTITTVSAGSPVPSVFVPAGTAGNYLRAR